MPLGTGARLDSREKARAYRERMRASGFRPVQFWVPDTRTAAFRAEAHRRNRVMVTVNVPGIIHGMCVHRQPAFPLRRDRWGNFAARRSTLDRAILLFLGLA